MKRLLLITDYFRPEPGGLEAFFSCLANQWQAEKIEVIVTNQKKNYLSSANERLDFEAKQDYRIYRPEIKNLPLYLLQKNNPLKDFFAKRLQYFAPEHILFSSVSLLSYTLAKQALLAGIPYSFVLHGGILHNKLNGWRFFNRRFIRQSNTVFSLSWYLARVAIEVGIPVDKICVLPPGFEPRWQSTNTTALPKWLRARIAKKILLLSVGPLVARKGLEKAIEATRFLFDQRLNVHYVIAGSGPEFAYLEEHSSALKMTNNVTLTDFVSDQFLGELFRRAHIFLQPGTRREDDIESLGLVFMEAAWFGVPVVAGKLGGVEEVVLDGATGFLTKVGNVQELTRHIHTLITSKNLHAKISQNAHATARKHFGAERIRDAIQRRLELTS